MAIVAFKAPIRAPLGAVPTVCPPAVVVHSAPMRPPYDTTDPPGATIHRLRQAAGMSQRQLADRCKPPLDHTTIRRLEHNLGYTQDTLERVAAVLGVRVADLFLPTELADWPKLPAPVRERIAAQVADAVIAARFRRAGS